MTPKKKRIVAAALAVLLLLTAGAFLASSQLRWRAELAWMKVTGELVIMSWSDVLTVMKPGNPERVGIPRLLETGNPIASRFITSENSAAGFELFRSHCASCHGLDATGGTGPDLTRARIQRYDRLFRVISGGIPGTSMNGVEIPDDEIWKIVAFLSTIQQDTEAIGPPPEDRPPPPEVTSNRLIHADEEPRNWLTYSGSYAGHRYSSLDQITSNNIRRLKLAWIRQLKTIDATVETTPLVVDGIMYLTEPPNIVLALDAATGEPIWRHERELPNGIKACCGDVNRGLAILGDRLYMGTLDAHLVALDATTGQVEWDVAVADFRTGHSITVAPLAVEDRIVVGISGGEYGIRGFLDAYDARTGERRWRFWTVPGPGEPGNETWEGDSWRTGGAPTWVTGSYDPELGLLYWGVGNPGPPWYGGERAGDNLYSNSVVALDAQTGALRWHFQFTPHDEHDWDANQVPVLVDAVFGGSTRKLMAWANRNAFYYLLDRETGEFLLGRAFAEQTWAEGLDETGRPIRRPEMSPSAAGTLVSPAGLGATNWWSPAYHPGTGLLYVPTIPESAAIFYTDPPEYQPGDMFLGSGMIQPQEEMERAVRALRPLTGEIAWEYVFPDRSYGRMGGVLTSAGDLVFAGAAETFVALRASTGEELWTFDTGGWIAAAPVTYEVDGRQHVTIAAGRTIFTFALQE